MTSEQNGYATENETRDEGRQEEEGQGYLHKQARADSASHQRKRDRIIYIENSSNVRGPFVLQEVGTVSELTEKLCEKYPEICLDSIGMKMSNAKQGVIGRQYFSDQIPYEYDTIFIYLYLHKHPGFTASKIEQARYP
jgi:hypothetical protein